MALTHDDIMTLRQEFPALQQRIDGRPIAFFDGPGGTQVHHSVIDAMTRYYTEANSNAHGLFEFTRRTDRSVAAARSAMADFLGAARPEEIVFGPNMTTLTFNISRAIARGLTPGDEIIVTRLDHDANVSPWTALAEVGVVIRTIDFDPADCTLDLNALHAAIGPRTKGIAIGYASNAVGTINDVKQVAAWAHAAGAWVYVDAVQLAPHVLIDVRELDVDYLACSAYKFFGPHLGVLYGRHDLLDALPAYKVTPAGNAPPDKFETGTPSFEAQAGAAAAVDYLASIGRRFGDLSSERRSGANDRRAEIVAGLNAIQSYERALGQRLIAGLEAIPGVQIYGITDPGRFDERVPVVSFTMDGRTPGDVARLMDRNNIFVWNGDFYAVSVIERLGLADTGGLVRVGIAHYNTADEIDRLLLVVGEAAGKTA